MTSNETKASDFPAGKGELDLTRLVGFAQIEQEQVDFRDETFAAKVGAKVGFPEN